MTFNEALHESEQMPDAEQKRVLKHFCVIAHGFPDIRDAFIESVANMKAVFLWEASLKRQEATLYD